MLFHMHAAVVAHHAFHFEFFLHDFLCQWFHFIVRLCRVADGGAFCYFYLFLFSRRLLVTTLTLLNAMAAPAIMGFSRKPLTG